MTTATRTSRPATAPQIALYTKLLNERIDIYTKSGVAEAADAIRGVLDTTIERFSQKPSRDASLTIDQAISNNKALRAENRQPVTEGTRPSGNQVTVTMPGMYKVDGELFYVQKAKNSDRLYAKNVVTNPIMGYDENDKLVQLKHEGGVLDGRLQFKTTFEYAPGAIYKITPDHRLTAEEAADFGHNYSNCCVCGRHLRNKESVRLGIGPVCGGRV